MPDLWPNSWYNTRYALAALPLAAFAGATLVTLTPLRLRLPAAMILVLGAAVPWAFKTNWPPSICWKESEVNSVARRAWTHALRQITRRARASFIRSVI
ncbi:MAG: hypothetical protein DMG59_06310 [Acidobacteria bacterium]|nr:MAG: hypothetical protein DMG59_06310 [Acidobacteriota bacterium]